jgi:hypothetical protein
MERAFQQPGLVDALFDPGRSQCVLLGGRGQLASLRHRRQRTEEADRDDGESDDVSSSVKPSAPFSEPSAAGYTRHSAAGDARAQSQRCGFARSG